MRLLAATFTVSICLAAQASAAPPELSLDNPAYSDPAKKWTSIEDAEAVVGSEPVVAEMPEWITDKRACRDVIEKARSEAGLPLLDRETASPDKAYLIYAVDRREGGCSVMVMKGNPGDVRQLPKPMEGPIEVIPAEADGK